MAEIHAVLSGDLVASSALKPAQVKRAQEDLLQAAASLRSWRKGGLLRGAPEFYAGDSWQLLLRDPVLSLRAALYLRAVMHARGLAETRVAIGIGPVDKQHINLKRISTSSGEAFTLSGRALHGLKRFAMTLAAASALHAADPWSRALVHMCDVMLAGITPRQAEIIAKKLHPSEPTQAAIAAELDITQQSVQKALESGRWELFAEALAAFEQFDWRGSGNV